MPAHQQPGAGKQGALGAQEPVADPATHKREKIEQAAVRADERGGLRLLHTEPTGGGVEVVREDGLHAIKAEALPHLDARNRRQNHGYAAN